MTLESEGSCYKQQIKMRSDEIAANPEDMELYGARADNYLYDKQYALAIKDYAVVEAVRPLRVWERFSRGMALLRIGEYEKAFVDFGLLIRVEHKLDDSLALRALSLFGLGHYDYAATDVIVSCRTYMGQALSPAFVEKLIECQQSNAVMSAEDRHAIVMTALDGAWRLPLVDTGAPEAGVEDTRSADEIFDDCVEDRFPLCRPQLAYTWKCPTCDETNPGSLLGPDHASVAILQDAGFTELALPDGSNPGDYLVIAPLSVCPNCGTQVRHWYDEFEKAQEEKTKDGATEAAA